MKTPDKKSRRRRAPDVRTGETWRVLDGWGAPYEVSDLGRVRKPATEVARRRVGAQHYRPFVLARYMRNGTPMVQLLLPDGRHRGVRVARLIAAAFLPPPPRGAVLSYLSADRSDVRAANLVWRPFQLRHPPVLLRDPAPPVSVAPTADRE